MENSRHQYPHAHQRSSTGHELVLLNVGGQSFLVRRSILFRVPHSRLYMVACNDFSVATGIIPNEPYYTWSAAHDRGNGNGNGSGYGNGNGKHYDCECTAIGNGGTTARNGKSNTTSEEDGADDVMHPNPTLQMPSEIIYFDRDPEIFRYILDYYRNGELHLPQSVCGPGTRKELIFWGVPETDIQACCLNHYAKYEEESSTKALLFKDFFEDLAPMKDLVKISRGWRQMRYKLWLFLDYPSSSWQAKAWATINLIFIILSVLVYSFRTHRWFRTLRPFATQHNLTEADVDELIAKLQRNISSNIDVDADALRADSRIANLTMTAAVDDTLVNPKVFRDIFTEPSELLVLIDVALTVYFLIEASMKFVVAPDRIKYLKRLTVLVEVVSQASFWVVIGMQVQMHAELNETTEFSWPQNVPNFLQSFRILRILKVAKLSDGLRVLILTLKRSITELALLGFLLANGMFLFAWIVYLVEYKQPSTFQDVPNAFWWAIITLTGVGYGDVTPTSGYGYLVGGFCAVTGCMVTGLAIPIIGNNFNTYYKYMKNQLREQKYLKDKGQNAETQHGGLLARVKMLRKNNRATAQLNVGNRVNRHGDENTKLSSPPLKNANSPVDGAFGYVAAAATVDEDKKNEMNPLMPAANSGQSSNRNLASFPEYDQCGNDAEVAHSGKRHESLPAIAVGDSFLMNKMQPRVRASMCA